MDGGYYLIFVEGVEPELHGPYASPESRDIAARRLGGDIEAAEDTLIFWLTIDHDGTPEVGTFAASFFEESGRAGNEP